MMRKIVTVPALLLAFLVGLEAAARAADVPSGPTLSLSVAEAVLSSLANNRSLQVQRLAPDVTRLGELAASAAFETTVDGRFSGSFTRGPEGTSGALADSDAQKLTLGAGRLLASGTTIGVELDGARSASGDSASTRLGLSVTQALLQGRGAEINLAAVRQARLDTALSLSELRGYTESLVAQVEEACWDYLLFVRRVAIVERSLSLAEAQLAEVRERIAVGRLAQIEQAAAEAEVALRRGLLIDARSARDSGRLRLLLLVHPPGRARWTAHSRSPTCRHSPPTTRPRSPTTSPWPCASAPSWPRRACNSSAATWSWCGPATVCCRAWISSFHSARPATPPRSPAASIWATGAT